MKIDSCASGSTRPRRSRQGAAPPRPISGRSAGLGKGYNRAGNDWTAKTAVPADTLKKIGEGLSKLPAGFTPMPKLANILVEARRGVQRQHLPRLGRCGSAGTRQPARSKARRSASSGRTCSAAPSATATPASTTSTTARNITRWRTSTETTGITAADFIIVNTMLSELAVLGFEYGFSSADPRNLCIWEAQFGDFVNGAQPIIDQFIAGAESKWQKFCGLVMLLPHGYEGPRPRALQRLHRAVPVAVRRGEHAGRRSEPAGAIFPFAPAANEARRSASRSIAMMPKSLLRADISVSSLQDLTEGSFQLVIDDPLIAAARARVGRLLLCSGKLSTSRSMGRARSTRPRIRRRRAGGAVVPVPEGGDSGAILKKYANAQEVVWVQEEPRNRGAWMFMQDRLTDGCSRRRRC